MWWLTGAALVLLVTYLSLANVAIHQIPSTMGDKLNHLIAYGVLTGWFGQLLLDWRHRALMAVVLIVFGVSMEVLQSMTGYRFFDWKDAIANSIGVICGLIALRAGADKILVRFESLL